MPVEIGVGLFTAQIPLSSGRSFAQEYRETLELVRLAESMGFDSAWVSEHHGSSDGYMPSLLPTLGAFAAVTDRLKLGTGVMLTPFHHPLRLAEDAATVDLISDGRLILGLGLGWREEEFRMFQVPISQRVARTTETIEILRRAWTGERFSHDGKVFQLDSVRVTPAPPRPGGPPIFLGATSEPAIRRAGRLADGFIRTRGAGVERAREDLDLAEQGVREAGRDLAAFGFVQLQNAFVSEGQDAWEIVREGVAHQLGVYGGWERGGDTPGQDLVPVPPGEETIRKRTALGTPDEVTHQLAPLVEAFGDRESFQLVVRLHYPGMDFSTAARAVELFGQRVLPSLKTAR